jgi:L-ascorbate metabolism protein UlaG (beta-lactamase superfamily)
MSIISDLENNPFKDRWHHLDSGQFRSPPGGAHYDGRKSSEMQSVIKELLLKGNRPFAYPHHHCVSRVNALAQLGGVNESKPLITWLGQACFYIQFSDLAIITDPFLSSRASPVSFGGPKRLVPAPITLKDLPRLDLIILSHNHYDHLDMKALKEVQHPKRVTIVTSLGCGKWFRKLGFEKIVEMDWYQQTMIEDACFQCLPAYHFSGRSLWDTNKTLWSGFAIKHNDKSVYFAGDTGYGEEFSRMGQLTGPYDVALVPIGAYGPPSVFGPVHTSPEEAVKIGEDIGADKLIGMHWGTIRLTTEPMWEPAERFMAAPTEKEKVLMSIGETNAL